MEEFFAVEKMTNRMVNNIVGMTLDSVSANLYIYLSIGFLVFAWVMFEVYKNKPFSIKDLGRKLLIITFAFWLLLEAHSFINCFSYTIDDFTQLFGKSIDEKHAITSPIGLYEFCQMVKKEIPADAKVYLVPAPDEYVNIKLNYYLAPYNATNSNEAEYLIGYMINPGTLKIEKYTQYGWIAKTKSEIIFKSQKEKSKT